MIIRGTSNSRFLVYVMEITVEYTVNLEFEIPLRVYSHELGQLTVFSGGNRVTRCFI